MHNPRANMHTCSQKPHKTHLLQLYTFFPGGNIIQHKQVLVSARSSVRVVFGYSNICTLSELFVKYCVQYAQYVDTGDKFIAGVVDTGAQLIAVGR